LSDELEKLEEVLEKKIKQEPYGGIIKIPRLSKIEKIAETICWYGRKIGNILKKSRNVPRIRGILFGVSILIVMPIITQNPGLGLGLLAFFVVLHILIYPDMLSLIAQFITYVIFDLVRKGSIASILTPREIEQKLLSVEYVLCASSPLLLLLLFPTSKIVIIFRIIGSAIVVVSAITYYYLTMALDCWKNPIREISERDILSVNFILLLLLFVVSALELYTIVPTGYSSVFCWIITLLSYAFISTILAVPSFQAALYVTTLWRGEDTRKMFEELQKKVRWSE